MRIPGLFFVFLLFANVLVAVEPTEEREWESTSGTKLTAVATKLSGDEVTLKSAAGIPEVMEIAVALGNPTQPRK